MPDFVYVVNLEEFYGPELGEIINSSVICVCESEEDAYKEVSAYMKNIVDKLKALDPHTYGYYTLDDDYLGYQEIDYWSDKYDRNISALVSVRIAPFVKSS